LMSDSFDTFLGAFINALRKRSGTLTADEALSIAQEVAPSDIAPQIIEHALDHHLVEKAIDYPPEDWDSFDKPIWYIRLVPPESAETYRILAPHKWALLKLLWNQNDRDHLGQMEFKVAQSELLKQGFSEDTLQFLFIEGVVDNLFTVENGNMIQWCYVIPEWEKTEEFRQSEQEIMRQAQEKEGTRLYLIHIDEIEADITDLLLKAPRGMSLEQITKHLPESYSARDIKEALSQAIDFGYVKEIKGAKGVRYQAIQSDEDD